jgi:hypothetical protein
MLYVQGNDNLLIILQLKLSMIASTLPHQCLQSHGFERQRDIKINLVDCHMKSSHFLLSDQDILFS